MLTIPSWSYNLPFHLRQPTQSPIFDYKFHTFIFWDELIFNLFFLVPAVTGYNVMILPSGKVSH